MAIGNMLSGLFGGTPVTGVLVRTSVNIKSGATDKMSQFINAISVLTMIYVIMPVYVFTPMPCIAAILMTASCRMCPLSVIGELWILDRAEVCILFLTTAICVCLMERSALWLELL